MWPGWARLGLVVAALLMTADRAAACRTAGGGGSGADPDQMPTLQRVAAKSDGAYTPARLLWGAARSRVNWNSPISSGTNLPPEPAALAAVPRVSGPRKMDLGVAVNLSPNTIADDFAGFVQLTISGLKPGESVQVEKFMVNAWGRSLDQGALLVESYGLADGRASAIGRRANINVPGDLTPSDGTIAARLSYVDRYATHVVGPYIYRVSSPEGRFPPASASFSVTNAPRFQTFSGRVLAGGQPVSNAFVVLLDSSGSGYKFVAGTAADDAGRYTLGADPGTYHLVAVKPGLSGRLAADTLRELESGAHRAADLELSLPTRTISGQVTDDSQPPVNLPGIQLYLHSNTGDFTVAYADANGRFEVPVVASQWQIEVPANAIHQAGYLVPQRALIADTRTNHAAGLQLALAKATGLLCGYVTNRSGAPVSGVEVLCYPENYANLAFGVTDTNGYYVVAVRPGNWWVEMTSRSLLDQGYLGQLGQLVCVQANQAAGASFGVGTTNATLAGSVRDDQGAPVEGAHLAAVSDQGDYAQTQTDAQGAFTLPAAGGQWTVYSLENTWANGFLYQGIENVVLSDAGRKTDLAFVSVRADRLIEVQIMNNLGQPVRNLYVVAGCQTGGLRFRSEGYTDEMGATRLGVFAGHWTTGFDPSELDLRGYQAPTPQSVTIADDDTQIKIVLELLDNAPLPPPEAQVKLTPPGRFQMTLPAKPGTRYVIQSSTDMVRWSNLATNTTGEAGTLTFVEEVNQVQRFYRARRK